MPETSGPEQGGLRAAAKSSRTDRFFIRGVPSDDDIERLLDHLGLAETGGSGAEPISLDDGDNADWIKGRTWEFPGDADAFLAAIGGIGELPSFMKLRAALAMPADLKADLEDRGLIAVAKDDDR